MITLLKSKTHKNGFWLKIGVGVGAKGFHLSLDEVKSLKIKMDKFNLSGGKILQRINNIKDLENASKLNKVLFCQGAKHPSKVSSIFLMEQSGKSLLRLFRKGLYVYER